MGLSPFGVGGFEEPTKGKEETVEVSDNYNIKDDTVSNITTYRPSQESLSPTVAKIKNEIRSMNNRASAVSDKILSNVKTKDCDRAEQILTESIRALNKVMSPEKAGALSSLLDKIPFAKKAKENLETTVVKNLSIKDNIDNMFNALGSSIRYVEQDLNTLAEMLDSLDEAIGQGENLSAELEQALLDGELRNIDKLTLETLKRQLLSINLINKETFKQIDMQLRTSHALATNMNEIQPLIKGMLSCQTALAAQNARNVRMKRTSEIVGETINEMIKSNANETNKVVLDTLKLCNKPVVEQKTIEHISEENTKFVQEFKETVTEIQNGMNTYLEAINKTTAQLEQSKPDLLIGE